LPSLRGAAPSQVVNVSSGGMYTSKLEIDDLQLEHRDYDPPGFYAHTKRCEVILTELWAERLAGTGIAAASMHPGWADTPGVQTSLPRFRAVMRPLLRDADQAADTIVWLAGSPEAERRPGLFWHDRAPRPTHRVPWTRESEADRRRLWDACVRLSGWDDRIEAIEAPAASGRAEEA
jgi:NAD(P)-dependent dehydrogenase (short-subunit alcohol dehydrogenase family)